MQFNLFRRPDGALVVVPRLFKPPIALERAGGLRPIGTAHVELEHLTNDLVESIGVQGYAVASGPDEALLRIAASRRGARDLDVQPAGADPS